MSSLLLGVLGIKLPSKAVIIGAITGIILVASMVTYYQFNLNACNKARIKEIKAKNQAINELNDYINTQQTEYEKREAINQLKLENAEKNLKVVNESYQYQLENVKASYVKKQKQYDQKIELANISVDNMRELLRNQISTDIAARDNTPSDTEGDAQYWRERNATAVNQYENLKQACIITTLDFNALSGWRDEVCLMSKCGN